jgi:hypothetical protein
MSRADREPGDCFVFLASPIASGSYGLTIYPEIPEVASPLEVSKSKLQVFLMRHSSEIAVEKISGTDDLFVSAMTEDDVLELMGYAMSGRRFNPDLETRH